MLTLREREVLALLRDGMTYKQIAAELSDRGQKITEGTARVHGSSALRKLGRTRLAIQTP